MVSAPAAAKAAPQTRKNPKEFEFGAASSEEDSGIREEGFSVGLGTAEAGLNQDAQAEAGEKALLLVSSSKSTSVEIKARLWEDNDHQIESDDIPRSAWLVLTKLRGAGHEGYLVGGAVRDLLLGCPPKDFDILTSATVSQVRRLMDNYRAIVIGRRFPIVVVTVGKSQLEVSSFSTNAEHQAFPMDANAILGASGKGGGGNNFIPDASWSAARRWNAESRDFTVNALLYDPFANVIYDYTGGVRDCRQKVLRCIIDPELSFETDPARMLRAVRHSARTGLRIHRSTAAALRKLASRVLEIQPSRLIVEINALMAYGSAARSVKLLWENEMMGFVMPDLADYLNAAKYPRTRNMEKKDALFTMLERMDEQAAPWAPLPAVVWQACIIDFLITQASPTQATLRLQPVEAGAERNGQAEAQEEIKGEYLSRAKDFIDAMINHKDSKLIIKASREPLYRLLRQQLDHRLGLCKTMPLTCRGCGETKEVSTVLTREKHKCPNCGRGLPSKAMKDLRSSGLRAVLAALQ